MIESAKDSGHYPFGQALKPAEGTNDLWQERARQEVFGVGASAAWFGPNLFSAVSLCSDGIRVTLCEGADLIVTAELVVS